MINPPNAQLQEMRRVSEDETGRGSTFVQVYTLRDRTFEIRVVISVYEPACMLAFSISGQPFLPWNREDQVPPILVGLVFNREPIWLSYVLIPLANGTRLTRIVIKRPIEAVFAHISEVRPTRIKLEMQQERVEERIERACPGAGGHKGPHSTPHHSRPYCHERPTVMSFPSMLMGRRERLLRCECAGGRGWFRVDGGRSRIRWRRRNL
jgi:hypothetical protein